MEKDRINKRAETMRVMKISTLQICLLSIFLEGKKGQEHAIEDLCDQVYKKTGKRKPANARQSVTGMLRDVTQKIYPLKASVDRVSGEGRSAHGRYVLNGDIEEVRKTVERMILK